MEQIFRKPEKHFLMCVKDVGTSKCCQDNSCQESFAALKEICKNLGLPQGTVRATRTQCLGVCQDGPIMVVYPAGRWYKYCTIEAIQKIVAQEMNDTPATEYLLDTE